MANSVLVIPSYHLAPFHAVDHS